MYYYSRECNADVNFELKEGEVLFRNAAGTLEVRRLADIDPSVAKKERTPGNRLSEPVVRRFHLDTLRALAVREAKDKLKDLNT